MSTQVTRVEVKRLAHEMNPDVWVSYNGKTKKEKRWIETQQLLDKAAKALGFSHYLEVPEYMEFE
jgi:hypothetical protein